MKKDWGRVWFELRDEKGQSDIATMMYKDAGDTAFTPVHFPHRETDGLGRIQKILRQNGLYVKVASRPLTAPADWKNLFLTVKGILKHPTAKKNPWKFFVSRKSDAPEKVAYRTLSDEQNEKLKQKAQALNVSPAFYLLSVLTDLVRTEMFVNPEETSYWLFPVDLRGAFPEAPLDSLSISFLPIVMSGSALKQIQENYQNLRHSLKKQDYWAYHALYNIGRWIGRKGMQSIVNKTHEKSFWLGSFSDLGSWNQPEIMNSELKDRTWVIAPPGSPSYPVGFTTIEWCDKRTLTLKIHPAITNQDSLTVAEGLIGRLIQEIDNPTII